MTLLTQKNRNPELIVRRAERAARRTENKLVNAAHLKTSMEVNPIPVVQEIENQIEVSMDKDQNDTAMSGIHSVLLTNEYSPEKKYVDIGVQVDHTSVPRSNKMSDKCIQVDVDNIPRRKESFAKMLSTNRELNAFTGVSSFEQLDAIESCVKDLRESLDEKSVSGLPLRELILLVLIKLKLNLSFICLGTLFGISNNTCQRYFYKTLRNLSAVLKCAIPWPEKEEILDNLPKCFERYTNTRVVIDCFEIPIQRSKCLKCRLPSYSH